MRFLTEGPTRSAFKRSYLSIPAEPYLALVFRLADVTYHNAIVGCIDNWPALRSCVQIRPNAASSIVVPTSLWSLAACHLRRVAAATSNDAIGNTINDALWCLTAALRLFPGWWTGSFWLPAAG